jgi:hypothetical protein
VYVVIETVLLWQVLLNLNIIFLTNLKALLWKVVKVHAISGEILFEKLTLLNSRCFWLVKFSMLLKVQVYDSQSQENISGCPKRK